MVASYSPCIEAPTDTATRKALKAAGQNTPAYVVQATIPLYNLPSDTNALITCWTRLSPTELYVSWLALNTTYTVAPHIRPKILSAKRVPWLPALLQQRPTGDPNTGPVQPVARNAYEIAKRGL